LRANTLACSILPFYANELVFGEILYTLFFGPNGMAEKALLKTEHWSPLLGCASQGQGICTQDANAFLELLWLLGPTVVGWSDSLTH